MTEVKPGDEIVDGKKRLSIFYPTDLDFLLRNMRRRTVVLTGGFTDCCVLNAAFDAANRDYRVLVCRDLVRGFSTEMEDAAFRISAVMKLMGGAEVKEGIKRIWGCRSRC